jgi:hypothetical protein
MPGGGRAWGGVAAHKRHARGKGPTQGLGAKDTRGAHGEHEVHVCDAGGVEAQRLVEGRRLLPSRREGMRCGEGEVRAGRREGPGWWRHTSGMHVGKVRLKAWGPRARAERTSNMLLMAVTLEVSKLSGWLKALADCQVEGRACDAGGERCEPGGGRARGVVAARQEACTGRRPDSRLGGQGHARGAHVEHEVHGRDAGGVEAQRLVEGRRVLPSRREGMRCGGERWKPGGGRAWGGGGTQAARTRGKGPTQGSGAKGTRGAHAKHPAHGRDAGGVKAQRLVEGRRFLPSRREGMRCAGGEVRAGRREGPGWWRHTSGMHGKGPTQGLGAKGTRGAHVEHEVHVCDAGGVEAQRLVEGPRGLPSRREGMRCGGYRGASREAGGPGVWWRHDKRHARGWPGSRLGGQGHARGRARRTCGTCP